MIKDVNFSDGSSTLVIKNVNFSSFYVESGDSLKKASSSDKMKGTGVTAFLARSIFFSFLSLILKNKTEKIASFWQCLVFQRRLETE